MLRAGVFGHCIKNAVPEDQRSHENFIRLAAEKGFEGIELWDQFDDVKDQPERLRALAESVGIEIFGMGSAVHPGRDDPGKDEMLATVRGQIDTCAVLGAGVLSFTCVGAAARPGGTQLFSRSLVPLVEQLKALGAYAADKSIRLAVLNHAPFIMRSDNQEWVVKLVGMENVGACVDTGNYLGNSSEDPVSAARRLAGLTTMIRLCDNTPKADREVIEHFENTGELRVHNQAILGEGAANPRQCMQILVDGGYRGFVSLKRIGMRPDDSRDPLAYNARIIKEMIQSLDPPEGQRS